VSLLMGGLLHIGQLGQSDGIVCDVSMSIRAARKSKKTLLSALDLV